MNIVEIHEVKNTVEITSDTQIVVIQASGANGSDGVGVPSGGTTGQVLAKNSNTNYDTEWVDQEGSRSDYRNVFLLMGA